MKKTFCWLSILFFSCTAKPTESDAVADWTFADLHDAAGINSPLQAKGNILLNKGASFDGHSWLDAGQGADGELNISGKSITLFARVKADTITGYHPIVSKSGTDQNMAYSLSLRKDEDGIFVEALLGSDDIGGAFPLKYRLADTAILQWHDVLFRFNGKLSELYVDGILRDEEVTVGETRDWNKHALLIGASHTNPLLPGDTGSHSISNYFIGKMERVAIWATCLSDKKVAALSGLDSLRKDGLPQYYQEKHRPQFHFTAKKHWLNDPNGLVFYKGQYHLFFQYMPWNRHGAYKDWGHAVSTDLVHWTQTLDHITPHKVWGGCWSGSAVVDAENVSGFQVGNEKPILAFITNGGNPNDGFGPKNTQNIAYSTDGGKTFTYYDQNPVIKNIGETNRDPKVVWDARSKKWVMSLYMDTGSIFGIFTSTNLRDWEQTATIEFNRMGECPGFEPYALDGDTSNTKWVFSAANGNYCIGRFDGKKFYPETGTLIANYGTNFYAPQTWSNAPDGRHIQIAWMPTLKYPGMPFEQQMNFPTEQKLLTTSQGMRLVSTPVAEIKNLYGSSISWRKTIKGAGDNPLADLLGDTYDFRFTIDLQKASTVELLIRGATIQYDALRNILKAGGKAMQSEFPSDPWTAFVRKNVNASNNLGEGPLKPVNGKIELRILVDRTTLEIFGNNGELVMTSNFMPDDAITYGLRSDGAVQVDADIHALQSAWPK